MVLTDFVCAPQNSPNDLQMLSDAPAHHLFCLLPPVPPTQNALPEVLAVIQVRWPLFGDALRNQVLVTQRWGVLGEVLIPGVEPSGWVI